MKQAAKSLILLALGLVCNQNSIFASVQLDKKISCLFGKVQAGTRRCRKTAMRRMSAGGKRHSCNICCARSLQCTSETAACSDSRAVLPIRALPSDLQLLAFTDRQVARRQQQKLVDFGHRSKNLRIPAGESRGLDGCFVSANRIAANEQGIGLLSTMQIIGRSWPLRNRETLTVNATCLLLFIILFVDFARWRYAIYD